LTLACLDSEPAGLTILPALTSSLPATLYILDSDPADLDHLRHAVSLLPENPVYLLRSDILGILEPAGVYFLSAPLFLSYSHLRSLRTGQR
jgi:hypothetical protein